MTKPPLRITTTHTQAVSLASNDALPATPSPNEAAGLLRAPSMLHSSTSLSPLAETSTAGGNAGANDDPTSASHAALSKHAESDSDPHQDWMDLHESSEVDATHAASAITHAKQEMKKKKAQYTVKSDSYWHERVIKAHEKFGALYIFCIGVSAPCGAIYTTWSNTLPASGTINLLLSIILIGLGFVCLCCCLGEMASAFPFAGGSYGFARALLGQVAGQIVGLAESLEWLLIGVGFISLVSQGFTQMFATDPNLEGLWLFLLYAVSLFLNLMGGMYLYVPFAINTVVSVTFLVVYQLGMIPYADWTANAGTAAGQVAADGVTPVTTWFINGFSGFLQALPYAVFTLVGFEICPLVSEEVKTAKNSVPKGMIAASVLVCSMAVITLFAGVSCPQLTYGDLAATAFPLTDGYALIFGGPNATGIGADPRISVVLPVFTQWAAFMTCNMAWGRQMFAMARSGLLPHWLSGTWKRRGTPAAALISGSIMSLSAALIVRFVGSEYTAAANAMLFNIGITGCCINYIFQSVSFIMLRLRYNALARPFRSPLGIPGAVFVVIIFGLTLIGVAQYPYLWGSVLTFALWLLIGMIYYFAYARSHLFMSPEEYRSLFCLYSMQFIRRKQAKAIKASKHPSVIGVDNAVGTPANHPKSPPLVHKKTVSSLNGSMRRDSKVDSWAEPRTNSSVRLSQVGASALGGLPEGSPQGSPHSSSPHHLATRKVSGSMRIGVRSAQPSGRSTRSFSTHANVSTPNNNQNPAATTTETVTTTETPEIRERATTETSDNGPTSPSKLASPPSANGALSSTSTNKQKKAEISSVSLPNLIE